MTRALSGKIVIETHTEGVITKYQLPTGSAALQPQEVAETLSRLLDLYDATVASGLPEGTGANDAAILVAMLAAIQPIRSVANDFRGYRA